MTRVKLLPHNDKSYNIIVLLIVVVVLLYRTTSELVLPFEALERWSQLYGKQLTGLVEQATALTDIKANYLLMSPKVRKLDGAKMVNTIKRKIESLLNKKVAALKKSVAVAEQAYAKHVYDKQLRISYLKAKKLNVSEVDLQETAQFNDIAVDASRSTVHVPTTVYDESAEILNVVEWTSKLDDTFRDNYQKDQTLSWQYFGSSTGLFRIYPGIEWYSEGVDLYDCRTRDWYMQAASSPKDVVILIDASGSMKGLRMEIAKATVLKILDTLVDDDFFNILKFTETVEYLEPCFNKTIVQANSDNKKRFHDILMEGLKTQNIANFENAFIEAFELFRLVNETSKGCRCNHAIMLITDGAPEQYENVFVKYNWPQNDVRVFTYKIGREISDSRQLKWIACNNQGYYAHISTLADVHEHVQVRHLFANV